MDEQTLSKSEQERRFRLGAVRARKTKKAIIWLVILVLIGGGIYWFVDYSRKAKERQPGEAIAILGREHVPNAQKVATYNSNPPTSGPHYGVPADWGIYDRELPDEQLVHNLEHGGIWISYQNPSQAELVNALKDIVKGYPTKVILTPRPANDAPIAVAAWGRLLKLQTVDRKQIEGFIRAFMNKGPEFVP